MNYDIALVGYEEGENLGLGYIASYLESKSITVDIIPYEPNRKERIIKRLQNIQPEIVGFSLIFQRMVDDFADLIHYLRSNNIISHFTMGGHLATLRPGDLLKKIPGLDSIILCEGELTLFDLFSKLKNNNGWTKIEGLACRQSNHIRVNQYRDLIEDLDQLPFPKRKRAAFQYFNHGISTLLASRGCNYNCIFCSIHEFYKCSAGKVRRRRSPENVVAEIKYLFDKYNSRIFIFEDDDFPIKGNKNQTWIYRFFKLLDLYELSGKITWRISTRIDEIDFSVIPDMMKYGLISIYLGIEAGNDKSLALFNKKYTKEDVYNCLNSFEKLDLPYEFGFMILHPYCTLVTIEEDLIFLKNISQSGLANVHFTKMIPYAGTIIERDLKKAGRLKGDLSNPEYDFLDEKIDYFQLFLSYAFHERNFKRDGLLENLRYVKFDHIIRSYLKKNSVKLMENEIKDYIRLSNLTFISNTSKALSFINDNSLENIINQWQYLESIIESEKLFEQQVNQKIFDRFISQMNMA